MVKDELTCTLHSPSMFYATPWMDLQLLASAQLNMTVTNRVGWRQTYLIPRPSLRGFYIGCMWASGRTTPIRYKNENSAWDKANVLVLTYNITLITKPE